MTLSNVNLTFLAISKQSLKVSFLGGSLKLPIFGPNMLFDFIPVDSQCNFKVTLPLNYETSSVTNTLAAMNYT
eukprot:gene34423-40328_t